MLYYLHPALQFISVRAALAAVLAFAISMVVGPRLIRYLRCKKVLEKECETDSIN